MRRFLLDSTIASDYINRRHGIFEKARAEVAKGNPGIEHSASRDRNMKSLNSALSALRIWPLDSEAAFEYGRLHAELARLGRPIGVIDTMIAAIARTLGNCTVVSADSDLTVVPGLKVEDWREKS